ncbi:hypothetical protein LTR53_008924 [Teratosphaeriaceae sp. CCFEE 6253]|nr:hypothetical protein LTR53_008924 [Teratosphaeriaceae sp. CCFEE 6253]
MSVAKLPEHFVHQALDRKDLATAIIGSFLGLAWLTVILRFWVRGLIIRNVGWDDWTMLFTNLMYTAYCSVVFMTNSYNPDLMLGRLPPDEYVTIFNYLLADIALYIATTIVFKIALGLFFLRIMVDKWQRYTIYGTVGFAFVYGIGFFFFAVFQCGNPAHFLEKQILGTCVTGDALYAVNLTAGIINAVADWILALLPVVLLRKAQMPLPAKITAGCLMALGAVGSISSIVRLLFLNSFRPGPNFFWTSLKLTMWSIIECGLCISAASLATLRPLFQCCVENADVHTVFIRREYLRWQPCQEVEGQ